MGETKLLQPERVLTLSMPPLFWCERSHVIGHVDSAAALWLRWIFSCSWLLEIQALAAHSLPVFSAFLLFLSSTPPGPPLPPPLLSSFSSSTSSSSSTSFYNPNVSKITPLPLFFHPFIINSFLLSTPLFFSLLLFLPLPLPLSSMSFPPSSTSSFCSSCASSSS